MKKLLILLMAFLVVTACKKDEEEENTIPDPPTFEEQLVGSYVFTEGTFNQEVTMYNVMAAGDTSTFPPGADATDIVGSVLLSDSPCDDLANAAMELREDFSLYDICLGEDNEMESGTWSANEADSSLSLLIDYDFGVINIPISEITFNNDGISGNINGLPVPIDLSQPIDAANLQLISVAVIFTRVDI